MIFLTSSMPVASLLSAFVLSSWAGRTIVMLLAGASIAAWSLLIAKWMDLAKAEQATGSFLLTYRTEAHPVALFLKRQRYEPSPVYAIYEAVCRALGGALEGRSPAADDLFMGAVGAANQKLNHIQINAVRIAADRARAGQIADLERNLGFVAGATTSAPLLGLLGTLWVAMDVFDASLPGVDLAAQVAAAVPVVLLPLVAGLLVAVPCGVGRHLLGERIRRLGVQMEDFSRDVLLSVEAHYLQQK